MGLDIQIITDNDQEIGLTEIQDTAHDYWALHSLSRTFCNLMCRKHVVMHKPELDQIGEITGVDISPLYQMESYQSEEHLEWLLESAENEEEKQEYIREHEAAKENLAGNITVVQQTLDALIQRLQQIDNLPDLLLPTDFDSLGNADYFADFNLDKGKGPVYHNFGQDLRNFRRFLAFAKDRGATTVWFIYG